MIKINNVEISEEEFSKIAKEQGFVKTLIKKRWRANTKLGETYYKVSLDGEIYEVGGQGKNIDNFAYMSGNYFKTRKEAEVYKATILAKQGILDRLRELEGDWEVNWDGLTRNYTCYYDHPKKEILLSAWHIYQYLPSEYFSTKEAWQQVLEEIPNEVKLMLGVSDV